MRRWLVPVLLTGLPLVAHAQDARPTPEALMAACEQKLAEEPDYSQMKDVEAKALAAMVACREAAEASPDDIVAQRQYAVALLNGGQIEPAARILRDLAGRGDTQAQYMMFEVYAFRERGRSPERIVIGRAEAEAALRKAADAGHADAMAYLARFLHIGGPLKRNADEALAWAERAVAANGPFRVRLLLGELLSQPERSAAERKRGLALLEELAAAQTVDGRITLAVALRREGEGRNPERARALLEAAAQEGASAAAAPLAAMLLAGEGGPKDVTRALALLRDARMRVNPEARAALAMLHLEGRFVRREPRTALPLLEFRSYQDFETRMRVAALLMADANARLTSPNLFLFYMAEAADVGEPGALAALIELKLSRHVQLRDEKGGYELAEKAAATDDRILLRVLERRAAWSRTDASRRALWEKEVRAGIERLTAAGLAPAFTLHGKLLRQGIVFPQDDVAATRALQRAAELGDAEGMVLLAKAYDDGLGIPKNPREQVRWLREAAGRGSVEARRALIWEARFDSARQLTLRDSVTEQVALYNDQLGSVSIQDFIGFGAQGRMRDFQPRRVAEAVMEGYRLAPAGLGDDRMVPLMRRIPQELRREIEAVLKEAGHYKGEVEGYFGPEARAALGAWVDAGLGRDEPAAAPAKTAALAVEKPGAPSVKDIPTVPPEAIQAYWSRIMATFKGARNQKQAREAYRMLILMARGGNPHARYQLVKVWDDQKLPQELVTPAEITLWGIDVLLHRIGSMKDAKIEFVFNTTKIQMTRRMQGWVDGFMIAVRDDPRLSQEGELTGLLKDMIFVGGACDAIAARIRALKLADVSDNDGCGPVARDALLELVRTQGTTGTEIRNRVAAANQILKETAAGEASAGRKAPAKRR